MTHFSKSVYPNAKISKNFLEKKNKYYNGEYPDDLFYSDKIDNYYRKLNSLGYQVNRHLRNRVQQKKFTDRTMYVAIKRYLRKQNTFPTSSCNERMLLKNKYLTILYDIYHHRPVNSNNPVKVKNALLKKGYSSEKIETAIETKNDLLETGYSLVEINSLRDRKKALLKSGYSLVEIEMAKEKKLSFQVLMWNLVVLYNSSGREVL